MATLPRIDNDRDNEIRRKHALGLLLRYYLLSNNMRGSDLAALMHYKPTRRGDEAGQAITNLCNAGTSADYQAIQQLFLTHILTPTFLAKDLPTYVFSLISDAYPQQQILGFAEEMVRKNKLRSSPLLTLVRSAEFSDEAIKEIARKYVGIWNVIRYSHNGTRVVRAALAIEQPNISNNGHPFPRFEIRYRTSDVVRLDEGKSTSEFRYYTTEGALMPLKAHRYMLLAGLEDTGYPLFISAKVLDDDGLPIGNIKPRPRNNKLFNEFTGIVHRHHNDQHILFTAPVTFVRSIYKVIGEYPIERIRSWTPEEAIKVSQKEFDMDRVLENLRAAWRKSVTEGGGGALNA